MCYPRPSIPGTRVSSRRHTNEELVGEALACVRDKVIWRAAPFALSNLPSASVFLSPVALLAASFTVALTLLLDQALAI